MRSSRLSPGCSQSPPQPAGQDIPGTAPAQAFEVTESDGEALILVGGSRGVGSRWLDGRPGPLHLAAATGPGWVSALLLLEGPTQPTLVTAGYGHIRSWQLSGHAAGLAIHGAHNGWITNLRDYQTASERLLLSGGEDGAIKSWHLDGREGPVAVRDAHLGGVRALITLSDAAGQPVFVSGGPDGQLRFASGEYVASVEAHHGAVTALAVRFTESGPGVISGGDDGRVLAWSPEGDLVEEVPPLRSRAPVRSLAVTPDGVVLAGHEDGSLGLPPLGTAPSGDLMRAADNGRPLAPGPVTGVQAALIGGKLIVFSCSADGPVHVWSQSRQPLETVKEWSGISIWETLEHSCAANPGSQLVPRESVPVCAALAP